MPTLNQAVSAIDRHLGFPTSRSRQVARRLQEAGQFPLGAPGTAPVVDVDDVLNLVLALAADTTLHTAADAVTTYRSLVPHGADLSGAPASIPRTAGDALDVWAEIAINGEADIIRRDRIEVVSNGPGVAVHTPRGVARFVPAEANPNLWQDRGHLRAVSLRGAALVGCLRSLFQKEDA